MEHAGVLPTRSRAPPPRSRALWGYQDFGVRVGAPANPGFEPCGSLFLAHSVEKLTELAANVELQNPPGAPSELVEPARVAEIVPSLDPSSATDAAWCATTGRPSLWLAAGFSGHGFIMTPAAGRALADWIAGEDPGEAAAGFVFERFEYGDLLAETQVV